MGLDINSYLNLFDAILIIGVALPTLYLSTKVKVRTLGMLFGLLSAFLVFHGFYHLTYFLGDYTNSEAIVIGNAMIEPVSYLLLFCFAIYFARRGG